MKIKAFKVLPLIIAIITVMSLSSCNDFNNFFDDIADKFAEINPDNNQDNNPGDNQDNNHDNNQDNDSDKNTSTIYDWDNTEIVMAMNTNSNYGEFNPGVARYCAGLDNEKEYIDEIVANRNKTACENSKVSVLYQYTSSGWSDSGDSIFLSSYSGSPNVPDVFCDFAYDMNIAAIKGAFVNLYTTDIRYDSNNNGVVDNYLRFTKEDYDSAVSDEGYYTDYMNSFALTSDKAYLIASDYCTDVMRSAFVIPVNIKLLSEVEVDGDSYDIDDLYKTVWDGNWTYDKLAAISATVAQDNDGNGYTNLGDRIGFAAGTGSGITGAALLYSTDVKIIDKATLTYPETNSKLNDVAAALYKLFMHNPTVPTGICTVSVEEAKAAGYTGSFNELVAIRKQLSKKNNILFGGIVTLASLEDEDYQTMRNGDGFGIVPVPKYKDGVEYNTAVHNLARIIGISFRTSKFEMCTAFLNEVSTNSSKVLEQYYVDNFASKSAGSVGADNNAEMLKFVRNHISNCFDKTLDEVILYFKMSHQTTTWHKCLMENNYQINDFSSMYQTYAHEKADFLNKIKNYLQDIETRQKNFFDSLEKN